jgi:hypothetical protein
VDGGIAVAALMSSRVPEKAKVPESRQMPVGFAVRAEAA